MPRAAAPFLVLLGSGLLWPGNAVAQEVSLDSLIASRLGSLGSGLVASVFHEGELVLQKSWGSTSHASPGELDPQALFPFPGLTEVLLGATVRALDAGGALSADAPIGGVIPELPEPLGRLTLDDLLRHTGGFDDAPLPPDVSPQELAEGLQPEALIAPPGVVFSYSRYSFPLVAAVLERVSGLPVDELISSALLRPLGMERSTFDRTEASGRGLVSGHVALADPSGSWTVAEPVDRIDGLPVLFTTVPELVRFMTAWVSGELAAGPGALPPAPPMPAVDPYFTDGLWVGQYQLFSEVERTQRDVGHSVVMRAYPELGSVVAVWMNGEGPPGTDEADLPWHVAAYVAERLIGPDFPVTVTEELPDSAAPRAGADQLPLWAWAGRYVNANRGVILRPPQTEGMDAELAFFNGDRELPLERLPDGWVLARDPEDGAPVLRFRLLRDDRGARYLFLGAKAFVLVSPR
jgi:CubicO group peptidase (beta-lactamase class C family)